MAECVGPSEWGEQVVSWEETLSAEQTSAQHVWKGFGNFHSLGCPQPTFHCGSAQQKKRNCFPWVYFALKAKVETKSAST